MSDTNEDKTVALQATVSHFLEHSKIKSNGIREVPKDAFVEELARHGVTREEITRVQDVVDLVTTAAAHVAVHDVEQKIGEASKTDLADDTFRRNISATVRIPTFGGATDVTVKAEDRNPIPFRGGEEGGEPQFKTTYGRLRTSITTKARIHRDFHEEASSRIRKALGVVDDKD